MLTLWLGDEATVREKKVKRLGKVLSESATVRIGKEGLSEGVLDEVRRRLERDGVVKVRVLKSVAGRVDVRELALKASAKLGVELVDVRGHTFTIVRKKRSA